MPTAAPVCELSGVIVGPVASEFEKPSVMRAGPVDRTAPATSVRDPRGPLGLLLVLGITGAVYLQTAWFPFVNFDDDVHVYENRQVRTGLTWNNVQWAFGIHGPSQWHPLAWISHQIDCTLFGADRHGPSAGGHHIVNLLLHLANVALVYLFVRQLAGRIEPALLTAAVFGVHPLNVETVAWVSERRNTLCLLFVLLSLLAYLRYMRRRGITDFVAVCVCHATALMAKPLAVTTPCLLLMLDVWPLKRWEGRPSETFRWRTIVAEKAPLFALSLAAGLLTILCQRDAQAFRLGDSLPLPLRLENAAIACIDYLRTTFWPSGLSVFYPHPALLQPDAADALFWPAILSAGVLTLMTAACVGLRRRWPWLLLGWLWFLVTMLPMIGLLQVGEQQRADRYTYLPNLGLYLGLATSIPWARLQTGRWRQLSVAVPSLIVLALAAAAWLRTGTWRDSATLFEHALLADERNHLAHLNAGLAYAERGDTARAAAHYKAALAAKPQYALAHYNLGVLQQDMGNLSAALEHYQQALAIDPSHAASWIRRGSIWGMLQRFDQALADFEQAIRLDPDNPSPFYNIGLIREHLGQAAAARVAFEQALRADPSFAPARQKLGRAASRGGPENPTPPQTDREGF